AVAKAHFRQLANAGLDKRDRILLDIAIDTLIPPVTVLAVAAAVGSLASVAWAANHSAVPAYLWGLALYFVLFSVGRGWALSGLGASALASFAYAPVLVAERIALGVRRRAPRKAAG